MKQSCLLLLRCQALGWSLLKPSTSSRRCYPDKEFTDKYLLENQKRLKERHDMLVEGLRRIGIGCLKGSAALFCWVDMRHLLKSNTFKGEMELWKKIVYQVGLNISPGSSCHCDEPGWFRVCFANMSEDTLTLAMQRLKSFVDSGDCGSNHDSGHQRPQKAILDQVGPPLVVHRSQVRA
ncbi:unnamed protein product, partial [Musa acuminata subsp. burmannicoides]